MLFYLPPTSFPLPSFPNSWNQPAVLSGTQSVILFSTSFSISLRVPFNILLLKPTSHEVTIPWISYNGACFFLYTHQTTGLGGTVYIILGLHYHFNSPSPFPKNLQLWMSSYQNISSPTPHCYFHLATPRLTSPQSSLILVLASLSPNIVLF